MARILLVEDEAHLRLLYRLELAVEGYTVFDAGSGGEALRILEREEIDAVVLDLQLPDYHGLQLLDEMLCRQQALHIIIHSAYDRFREDFLSWGADDYVLKSSDLTELKQALTRVAPAPKSLCESFAAPAASLRAYRRAPGRVARSASVNLREKNRDAG